jgi:HK97 family phage major capsid protein
MNFQKRNLFMNLQARKEALRKLGGATSLRLPENIYQVAKLRTATKEKAEKMNADAQAAGRDFTAEESTEFQGLVDVLEACSARIEHDAKHGGLHGGPHNAFAGHNTFHIPGTKRESINIPSDALEDQPEGLAAIGDWMRGKISASDTPLFINSAPVSPGLQTSVPVTILDPLRAYFAPDSFRQAGSTLYLTEDTAPLVKPIISAGVDPDAMAEGAQSTESHPFAADSFTFHGQKFSRLVKVSEEALMNVAMDLPTEILNELASSVVDGFTKTCTTALVAALQSNSSTYVDDGADAYDAILSLMAAVPLRFEDPSNCFMLSKADLKIIRNTRSTTGKPLFDAEGDTILGRRYVINPNLTRVVYGNWGAGAFIRKSPFFLMRLLELYSQQGEQGFRATQYLDQKFLASVSSVTVQPLYYTNLETEGS